MRDFLQWIEDGSNQRQRQRLEFQWAWVNDVACFEKNLDTLDRPCCLRHAASHLSGFQLPLNIFEHNNPYPSRIC